MSQDQGGASVPPYSFAHSGPVLICGSAECLPDDLERARLVYPEAPCIAVNGASRLVYAFAVFTLHPREMERWRRWQRGIHADFTTHAAGKAHLRTKLGKMPDLSPHVDYWWEGVATGGTSVWGARRMARFMGFDPVVLCGAPLEPGGYFYGGASKQNRRLDTMKHYRGQIRADTDMHAGVYAMSGWPREFFGEPF